MVEPCNSAILATNARYLQVDVRFYCGIMHIGVSLLAVAGQFILLK